MEPRGFYVYILASQIGGTLYIGDLPRRVAEHKFKAAEAFTKRHDVDRPVYFECFESVESAIHREKRLKKWTRAWTASSRAMTVLWCGCSTSPAVTARESGWPSIPGRPRSIIDAPAYWVARSTRAMTVFPAEYASTGP